MILDSLVILIMKNVNIARLYFLYGGLYWKILAKTIVWYLSVSKWRIFKMKLKNKLAGYLEYCKFSANYAQTECQFRYCGTAIPFLTVRSTAR